MDVWVGTYMTTRVVRSEFLIIIILMLMYIINSSNVFSAVALSISIISIRQNQTADA